ncbi:MAG: 50S ribosomal protein L11 methyltransferase [Clostridia bacterium]|nr:50S ribosomal protein L11 methyltransferase [Clostridia bacterium]MCI9086240.1 50S ribosomal protein L11 methyltransferase [Clostridia bacterium]
MNWIKVSVFTTSEGIEPVSGRLYQLGISGLEIEDEQDFKDFLENNKQYWDYVDEELVKKMEGETKVKTYVSDDTEGRELLIAIKSTLSELKQLDANNEFGRLEIELDNMTEQDWANNWRQYFHQIEIGEKVMIKPEWEELNKPTDRVVFNIEPGMSFGTGSHYTTQLCIESLEKYITQRVKMLDLGCGSGILSIISLLLGADMAVAVDIDPNAVDTAYQNADRNGVDRSKYKVLSGNVLTDSDIQAEISKNKYEVVAANIVADVIIGLAPKAKEYMAENGVFITSGIISDRLDDVKNALYENGFNIVSINQRKDWVSIVCR